MLRIAASLTLSVVVQVGLAEELPVGTRPPDAAVPREKSTMAESSATKVLDFELPPGFKAVKRGEIAVYCQKDATVGTRFKTRKCYNEEQLRAYLLGIRLAAAFPTDGCALTRFGF